MSITVPFNGTNYLIPSTGDNSWGTSVTNFLSDVGNNAVTKGTSQSLANKLIQLAPGTVGTPALNFAADTDTGLYQPAAGKLSLVTNGSTMLALDSTSSLVTVTGSLNVSGALSGAAFASLTAQGNTKNAVVNGGMEVWQRGGATILPNVGTWTADRWKTSFDGTGGTTVVSQVANTSSSLLDLGLVTAMSHNVTVAPTGGTYRQLQTQIELVRTFAGRTVTVSYWAWTAAGTVASSAFLSQVFGTGGSPSATVNYTSGLFTYSNVPAKYSFQTTLGSIAGKTNGSNNNDHLLLTLNLPLTGTYQVFVTGVQIELGNVATDFAYRPFAQEVALCQRYYQLGNYAIWGYAVAGITIGSASQLIAYMRATPVMSVAPSGNTNATALSVVANTTSITSTAQTVATGGMLATGVYSCTAEMI